MVVFKYLTNYPAEVTRLKVPAIFGAAGKTINVMLNDKLKLIGPPAEIPGTFEKPEFKEVKVSDAEVPGSQDDCMEMICGEGRNLKEEAVHEHETPKGDERSLRQDVLEEEGISEREDWRAAEDAGQNAVDATAARLGHEVNETQKKEPMLQKLIIELESKLEQVKSSCEEGFIEQQKLQNVFHELKNQQDILTEEMIHLGEQLKTQKELFIEKKDEAAGQREPGEQVGGSHADAGRGGMNLGFGPADVRTTAQKLRRQSHRNFQGGGRNRGWPGQIFFQSRGLPPQEHPQAVNSRTG